MTRRHDDADFERWAEALFQPPPAYPGDPPSDEDLEEMSEAFGAPGPYSGNRGEYNARKRQEERQELRESRENAEPLTDDVVVEAYSEMFV